jgi:hypothetical protein
MGATEKRLSKSLINNTFRWLPGTAPYDKERVKAASIA